MSYQKWNGYPDSPVTIEEYRYQCIIGDDTYKYLIVSKTYLTLDQATNYLWYNHNYATTDSKTYILSSGAWNLEESFANADGAQSVNLTDSPLKEANVNIYTDLSLTKVAFSKTTGAKPIASIALNPANHKQYVIALASPIASGETPKLSYTKGIVVPEYQKWSGYPDSPVKTSDYPYQFIGYQPDGLGGTIILLYLSNKKMYATPNSDYYKIYNSDSTSFLHYKLVNGIWGELATSDLHVSYGFSQSNNPIYTDNTFTTIRAPKTTTDTESSITATDGSILADIVDFLITNSAAVIPHLVSATTNTAGTQVILTFDTDMTDPSGKVAEFGVSDIMTYQVWDDGKISPVPTSSYPYQVRGNYNSDVMLFVSPTPFHMNGGGFSNYFYGSSGAITKSYKWNGTTGLWEDQVWDNNRSISILTTFRYCNSTIYTDSSLSVVSRNMTTSPKTTLPLSSAALHSDYQHWSGYPDSPVKTSDYPYQAIRVYMDIEPRLFVSKNKLYKTGGTLYGPASAKAFKLINGVWTLEVDSPSAPISGAVTSIPECNFDVYTSNTYSSVYKAKTTAAGDPKKIVLNLNITGEYQKWAGYPDSPVRTADYPYQFIATNPLDSAKTYLWASTQKWYKDGTSSPTYLNTGVPSPIGFKYFIINNGVWGPIQTGTNMQSAPIEVIKESNNDIYTSTSLSSVHFTKNSPILSSPITSTQTIKTSYTKGTELSVTGGALESYTDQAVTNAVP